MPSIASLSDMSPFVLAVLASLTGGLLATTAGALPVLVVRRLSPRVNNMMLSFAADVMLAATAFSLLMPGVALAAGTMLFVISDEVIPETHRAGFGDIATAGCSTRLTSAGQEIANFTGAVTTSDRSPCARSHLDT